MRSTSARSIVAVAVVSACVLHAPSAAATDGEIVAWGYNSQGQSTAPSPNSDFIAVAAGGEHSLGLKADGSIVAWGNNGNGQCNVPSPNTGFVAVAAGAWHSLGLRADGTIAAWGYNGHGQCNVDWPNSGYVGVSAGTYHSLGLRADGSIEGWGYNGNGALSVPVPNRDFVAVAAGVSHSLGLKADGSVVAWGDNSFGQCEVPVPNHHFAAVAAHGYSSSGLIANGSIVSWGDNRNGQGSIPSPNADFVNIAGGFSHRLGLRVDGSIVAWGFNGVGQCNVPPPNSGFSGIAAGLDHSLGVRGPAPAMPRVFCKSLQIYDPASGAHDTTLIGEIVTLEGIVYEAPSTLCSDGVGYLEDNTGGIIFFRTNVPSDIGIGDRVRITGRLEASGDELYVGQYEYMKFESGPPTAPTLHSVGALLGDLGHTGAYVLVRGTIDDLTEDTFWLEQDGDRIEVRGNCTGVAFGALTEGARYSVISPCRKDGATLYLSPVRQADIIRSVHYVGNSGDNNNPGTRDLPYRTIQHAVEVAVSGDEVVLLDGTYSGEGNVDVSWSEKNLHIRSDSGNRSACVISCSGSGGLSFTDTVADIQHDLRFSGFSITGASRAISVIGGADQYGFVPVKVSVRNCDLRHGGDGLYLTAATLAASSALIAENSGYGIACYASWNTVSIDSTTVRGNGVGVTLGAGWSLNTTINETAIVQNDFNLRYCQDSGTTTLRHSRVDSASVGSGIWACGFIVRLVLEDCTVSSNATNGVAYSSDSVWSELVATRCTIARNGLHGIGQHGWQVGMRLRDVEIATNQGWGIGPLVRDAKSDDLCGERFAGRDPKRLDGYSIMDECMIRGNSLGGAILRGSFHSVDLDSTVIVDNHGPGLHLESTFADASYSLSNVSVAGNHGPGVRVLAGSGPLTLDHALVAHNLGAAMDPLGVGAGPLLVRCTNIFGNTGGDWLGPIAPYLGVDGNTSHIPLFCDALGGDYHLQPNSPLAAANNPCGTIGALDVGCEAPILNCRELQVYDPESGLCDPTMFNIPVTVEGVVYVAPGSYSEYGGGYLQDDTGGMNFWRFPVPTAIRRGDRIRATGPLWPDGDENLYIGNFTYTKLDSQLVPLPVARTIAEIHGDYSLTCEYVKVTGRVANASADGFLLRDGTGEIEVRRNAYGGVDFSAVVDSALLVISSPVIKQGPTSYLMPAMQGDLIRCRQHFVGNEGDDDNTGTRDFPFRTIQRAVDTSFSGDEVVILDGHYTGPGNVSVTWQDKALTFRSDSNDRERCRLDCYGQPGFIYTDTDAADRDTLEFSGVTIAGASVAIGATGTESQTGLVSVLAIIRNCSLVDGDVGVRIYEGEVIVERSDVCRNSTVGISISGVTGHSRIRSCLIRENRLGIGQSPLWNGVAIIDSTSIIANGSGVAYVADNGRISLSHCRVDSSTAGDGLHVRMWIGGPSLQDCTFYGNARSGVRFGADGSGTLFAVRCESVGNGLHGFELGKYYSHDSFDEVLIKDNCGWGIGSLVWPPQDSASTERSRDVLYPRGWLSMRNSEVRDNADGGIDANLAGKLEFADLAVLDNGGPGVEFVDGDSGRIVTFADVTIAGNRGDGMLLAHCGGTGTRLAIAGNDSLGINLGEDAALNLACTDIYGNRSGDWIGALAPQLGVDGNLNVDPLFCNAAAGDYTLQENSPLAAENNPGCGTIGRYEAACPAQPWAPFEPRVRDVPDDQGGFLSVAWLRHGADAPSATVPITHYDVQRHHAEWQTITTLAAAAADSYAVTIATTDVQTIGQPLPWSKYRLVARTATPSIFFESAVDSAYSIDNLPPPKPDAQLVDGLDYRYIVWTNPDISDLATACVFRGESAGFTPGDPLSCPPGGVFTETHLAWYFYRVQFADIHGNLSEFSDELHGQWPTGVPGALPTALRLHPCRPNPFNPRTTITYDLPEAGGVRLAVFDLAGRLVRMLVDESRSQGSYEVVWDGRDDTGREVGSGTYLARLEFGGKMEVVRMGLVR